MNYLLGLSSENLPRIIVSESVILIGSSKRKCDIIELIAEVGRRYEVKAVLLRLELFVRLNQVEASRVGAFKIRPCEYISVEKSRLKIQNRPYTP